MDSKIMLTVHVHFPTRINVLHSVEIPQNRIEIDFFTVSNKVLPHTLISFICYL